MARLILLDDEPDLREELAEVIRRHGHEVTEAGTIAEFRTAFARSDFDIAIIDRMLPDGDGLDLVAELRDVDERCGIVMLTARDASVDRINGYERGADYYLGKPVLSAELLAIIDALAWRVRSPAVWRLDPSCWSLLTPQNMAVELTAQEFAFLRALALSRRETVSRNDIVRALGKDFNSYDVRNLDALLKRLRKKVGDVNDLTLPVKTVHSIGYALTAKIEILKV